MPHNARRYVHSSSFKMALLFTVLLGLSSCVLLGFSSYFRQERLLASQETLLDGEASLLITADRQGNLVPLLRDLSKDHDRIYLLTDVAGRALSGNVTRLPKTLNDSTISVIAFQDEKRLYAVKNYALPNNRKILIAADITHDTASYQLFRILCYIGILLMGLVVLVSYVISNFVVSRTNRIALAAKNIMETADLSQRIGIDGSWDDLSYSVKVLNELLGRIEELMQGIRQVSDNIAHDLRTPLTRLINDLESLKQLKSIEGDAIAQQICDAILQEASRLLNIFHALLRIARIESQHQRQNFIPIDLRQIAVDIADLYDPMMEEKKITFIADLQDTAMINGDRDLLFQAFANVLDNALKFTPTGGAITLRLYAHPGRSVISIEDNGPGIKAEDKDKIFKRFYRAESSRTTEGSGLGLSLVIAVIDLHGGRIELHDRNSGLKLDMILPIITHL